MYSVKLYRPNEARTVEIGPFAFCADAQAELDRQLATGVYASGFVDQQAEDYRPGVQDPSPWYGR